VWILRLVISALCLPILLIHTHACAADSSSWRFVQTAEPELNNLDDHKQPSSTLDSLSCAIRSNRRQVRMTYRLYS
jgi:hypothetical protein